MLAPSAKPKFQGSENFDMFESLILLRACVREGVGEQNYQQQLHPLFSPHPFVCLSRLPIARLAVQGKRWNGKIRLVDGTIWTHFDAE